MAEESSKRSVNRSPEHPAVDLSTALLRAEELYKAEGFNWTSPDVAITQWGYSPKTSSGTRTLAALKHFGLLEDTGTAKDRRVRLSELSKRIIRDKRESSPERVRAIREAALTPSIYSKLWDQWAEHDRLPSRSTMEYELEHTWSFNPNAVNGFVRDFVSTIEYAGLLGRDGDEDAEEAAERDEDPRGTDSRRSVPDVKGHTLSSVGQAGSLSSRDRLEFPIPLISGERAVLTIPVPLTEADFSLLVQMLQTTLPLMKPAIVRDKESPRSSSSLKGPFGGSDDG